MGRKIESPANDSLELAALCLKMLLLFSVALSLFVFAHASLRAPVERGGGATLFRALVLSNLAVVPSGREARDPLGIDLRVDGRISPFFPFPNPDPGRLLSEGAEQLLPQPMGKRSGSETELFKPRMKGA
ncbi:MAG: hypothetical protein C4576_18355 [Desulfobacteraceae bacterium]|nr:MAG: hypothetical protein C4576_18355 [Desulfobacteraceae bacterium]